MGCRSRATYDQRGCGRSTPFAATEHNTTQFESDWVNEGRPRYQLPAEWDRFIGIVPEGYVLDSLPAIRHIPAIAVHGRFDLCTPGSSAARLARVYGPRRMPRAGPPRGPAADRSRHHLTHLRDLLSSHESHVRVFTAQRQTSVCWVARQAAGSEMTAADHRDRHPPVTLREFRCALSHVSSAGFICVGSRRETALSSDDVQHA
jgi:hypothetical protein